MKPPKNFYSNLDRRKQGLPELPEASASDVGKIVKVGSGGDYELGQDAGAKELAITLASDFTANKTYTEILASLNNGDIVKLTDWTGRNYIYSGMTSGRICFAYLNGHSNTNESDVFTVAVDDTNAWELFLDTITHLPDHSSSDNGKFLGVDSNGDLEFANVPNELPDVTSADAGKFWGVDNNGAWELTSDIVTISYDASAGGPVLSKDIEEVISIINGGTMIDFVYGINHYILNQITKTELIIVNVIGSFPSGGTKVLTVNQIAFNRSTGVGVYKDGFIALT